MKGRVAGLLFSIFLFLSLCFGVNANAKSQFIINQVLPDNAGKLIVITGTGDENFALKISKTSIPARLIVDVNNTILPGQRRSIKINNENVRDFRIAQFSSSPASVRLVLTVDSLSTLQKIKVSKNLNTILFDLNQITPQNIAETPSYKDREPAEPADEDISIQSDDYIKPVSLNLDKPNDDNDKNAVIKSLQNKIDHNIVLKNIKHFDNRVIISGAGLLSLTEPILLDNPKRIAIDIPDGVVSSKDMLQPISLKNGDFVRIGQFDDNTVRIVIESKTPEIYKTIMSPDMQSIIIAPEKEVSFLEFPDSQSIGEVQGIRVIKQDSKTTKIILTSQKPIIHDLEHPSSSDKLSLDLYNLKQPRYDLITNLTKTGQFHGINIERIQKYPNGSRWIFNLNKTTKIESKLSPNGRTLELTLKDVLPVMVASKSNFKRKIVLDAGHGGQEPGAMRAGIYEKNITIDVVKRIKSNLQQAGVKVIMTREADESVSLKQRTIITNTENPDAFISVHINSSESSQARGLETYWYTPQSKELAQIVHTKLVNNINSPDRGIKTARFYVIRNTQVPAILAEIGYISNNAERADLLTDDRKDATAKAISDGILNYLRSKNSGSYSGRQSL